MSANPLDKLGQYHRLNRQWELEEGPQVDLQGYFEIGNLNRQLADGFRSLIQSEAPLPAPAQTPSLRRPAQPVCAGIALSPAPSRPLLQPVRALTALRLTWR